jgi:vitamin B12/bleomycin/antimicrobial peptide transport system ATP-binding/permease protein
VSIAHRPNVAAFHNQVWELEKTPEGSDARYGLVARQLVEPPLKTV